MSDRKNRTETGQKIRYGKDHVKYWYGRMRKRSYVHDGKRIQIPEWQVRIQYAGKEAWFNLGTPNREAAAEKAREISLVVRANGMEAAIERYKDKPLPKIKEPTIGEFISAVMESALLEPKTAALYVRKFRTIAAGIHGISRWTTVGKKGTDRKYSKAGSAKWRAEVDSKKLGSLSPEKVHQWARRYVREHGQTPVLKKRAEHTVNSCIRNARALFNPKILKSLPSITMPETLPFTGVELFRGGSMRYHSQIDPISLLRKGQEELALSNPEQFKALMLCLLLGLRRREADLLSWDAVLWDQGVVRIARSEFFSPKQEASLGDIPVEPEMLEMLRFYFQRRNGDFVLESNVPPRPDAVYHQYRANKHFKGLIKWLRQNGVNTLCPIHTLRKEFGRLICEGHGIYAASRLLRHANIAITAAHYVDDRRKISTGLGKNLDGKWAKSSEMESSVPSLTSK